MKKVVFLITLVYMTLFITNASAVEVQSVDSATLHTGGYTPIDPELIIIEDVTPQYLYSDNTSDFNNIDLLSADSETEISPSEYYGLNALKSLDLKNGNTMYQNMYNAVAQGMAEASTRIDIGTFGDITVSDFNMVFEACINDYPQYYYYNLGYYPYGYSGSSYISYIEPLYTDNHTPEDIAAFETAADKIITAAGITDSMTDYEKALALHNELAYHVEYNEDVTAASKLTDPDEYQAAINAAMAKYPYMHSAYGALVEGNAVCDGYARAYQYLLYKVGILSHVATGTANGGGHAWNAVKLDGEWYYTDLTWNDQTGGIFYSYFNITSARMGLNHTVGNRYSLPNATATANNYYVKNPAYVYTGQNAAAIISTVAAQLEDSICARIYAPDYSNTEIQTWVSNNINAMISLADDDRLSSPYTTVTTSFGGEYHIIFTKLPTVNDVFQSTLYADKDFYVSIMDMTDTTNKFVQVFYDSNGAISKIVFKDVTLTPNELSIQYLHPASDFDNFSSVSYFLWNGYDNMIPITNNSSLNY